MSDWAPVAELLDKLIAQTRAAHPERPALIGVAGAQGSGKSTLCRAFAKAHPRVAHFSLDDVYYRPHRRAAFAARFHPLLATRGPPRTHDLGLADRAIIELTRATEDSETFLPAYDKRIDDRVERERWPRFHGRPDAILVDGWLLGATAPPDTPPLNELERECDSDGRWRALVANELNGVSLSFFARFDEIVYLKPPRFEVVRSWRGQQEEDMLGRAMTADEAAKLDRFVQHYERITRHMIEGGHRAGWIVRLDDARNVLGIEPVR